MVLLTPRLVAALCATLLLAGCAENPVTGRSQFLVVSEEQAIASSATAYREMIADYARKGRLESGTPRAARVRAIADRKIGVYSGLPSPASCSPGTAASTRSSP